MREETYRPWGILNGIRPAKIATQLLLEGKSKEEILNHFMVSCETTPEKAELAYEVAMREFQVLLRHLLPLSQSLLQRRPPHSPSSIQ